MKKNQNNVVQFTCLLNLSRIFFSPVYAEEKAQEQLIIFF